MRNKILGFVCNASQAGTALEAAEVQAQLTGGYSGMDWAAQLLPCMPSARLPYLLHISTLVHCSTAQPPVIDQGKATAILDRLKARLQGQAESKFRLSGYQRCVLVLIDPWQSTAACHMLVHLHPTRCINACPF